MQDASKQVRQLEKEQENASEKGIRASKHLLMNIAVLRKPDNSWYSFRTSNSA
jgi:hypothetical protein